MNTFSNFGKYRRLTTTPEWILVVLGILSMGIDMSFTFLTIVFWGAAIAVQIFSTNLSVKDINTGEKLVVSRQQWNEYCQQNSITFFGQYSHNR